MSWKYPRDVVDELVCARQEASTKKGADPGLARPVPHFGAGGAGHGLVGGEVPVVILEPIG